MNDIKAPSLANHALEALRDAILWVELKPGERLTMESLQQRFGSSSTPLREALNRLTAEGLVEFEERRGFRVAPVSAAEALDITRVRVLLEREALADAIAHGRDDWEAALLAAHHRLATVEKRMSDVAPSLNAEWSARHREFHAALIGACTSPLLIALCADYFARAERYRRISARQRTQSRKKNSEHARIMRAALERNRDEALALIEAHIRQTTRHVVAALAEQSQVA